MPTSCEVSRPIVSLFLSVYVAAERTSMLDPPCFLSLNTCDPLVSSIIDYWTCPIFEFLWDPPYDSEASISLLSLSRCVLNSGSPAIICFCSSASSSVWDVLGSNEFLRLLFRLFLMSSKSYSLSFILSFFIESIISILIYLLILFL